MITKEFSLKGIRNSSARKAPWDKTEGKARAVYISSDAITVADDRTLANRTVADDRTFKSM